MISDFYGFSKKLSFIFHKQTAKAVSSPEATRAETGPAIFKKTVAFPTITLMCLSQSTVGEAKVFKSLANLYTSLVATNNLKP